MSHCVTVGKSGDEWDETVPTPWESPRTPADPFGMTETEQSSAVPPSWCCAAVPVTPLLCPAAHKVGPQVLSSFSPAEKHHGASGPRKKQHSGIHPSRTPPSISIFSV